MHPIDFLKSVRSHHALTLEFVLCSTLCLGFFSFRASIAFLLAWHLSSKVFFVLFVPLETWFGMTRDIERRGILVALNRRPLGGPDSLILTREREMRSHLDLQGDEVLMMSGVC